MTDHNLVGRKDRDGLPIRQTDLGPGMSRIEPLDVDVLSEIPDIRQADDDGFPTAYLRFYERNGRGEWLIVGKIPDTNRLYGWVRSPLGESGDEYGSFDVTELDYVRQSLGCGEILLDDTFPPQPFDTKAVIDGRDPLPERNQHGH